MIIHIVGWRFRGDLTESGRCEALCEIKKGLEGLVGVVPGLISAKVITEPLPSSSFDFALVTELESKQALEDYQKHPAHLKAGELVGRVRSSRECLDYEIHTKIQ